MTAKRKSFVIHIDSLNVLDDLSDEQAGLLFRAIKAHHCDDELELDPLTKVAFSPFKNQFERDSENYTSTVERNRINGLKGGRPKKQQEATESEKTQVVINKPKKADSDSDSKSDNKNKRFIKPTAIEVQSFFEEKGYSDNGFGETFVAHYETVGWKVGKNQMKNWKSAVTGWINRGSYKLAQTNQHESKEQYPEVDEHALMMEMIRNGV